jgi:two-component system OmpR family sensor kinase
MTPGPTTVPLRRQLVLVATGVTAAAMLLLVLLVQLVLQHVVSGNIDAVLRDRAASARDVLEGADAGPRSSDLDDVGPGVVVFDGSGTRVAGRVPQVAAGTVGRLSTTRTRETVEVAEQVRLLALPYAGASGGGVVVAVESVAPYERAEHYALVASGLLGLVAVASVAAVTAWSTRRTLAPVAAMAATADDWSVHDLGRRFDLGPPTTEITALGATLDRLLDRVGGALRAEQRLTAEVAHEIRTPLTALIGSAEVALMRRDLDEPTRAAFEDIADAGRRMSQTVTALVDLARSGAESFAESSTVEEVVAAAGADGVDVRLSAADRALVVTLPASLAGRALAPVLDNARAHCTERVVMTACAETDHVDLVVEDDGPGLADDAGLFTPGVRGQDSPGAGLGLPLARRIARAAGGDVRWEPSPAGARFVVRLPRA